MTFALEPELRLVGRYLLCGEFAEGGMATVHFGRVLGTDPPEIVAVKRPHQHFASHPDCAQLFREEAALAMRIDHPNVVPMLDVVAIDDELFLVMQYVEGETLGSVVRTVRKAGGRVPLPILGSIMTGLLEGLHAAHETKGDSGEPLEIVHRDVSPHNVIIGVDGRTRVLDFGVAKALGRVRTVADEPMTGKLSYMAPEQVRGASVDRRADLYAASILLWEAATTKRLFTGQTDRAIILSQLSTPAPPPSSVASDVPPELDHIALRGLAKTPDMRFSTALEMADAIAKVLPQAADAEVAEWLGEVAKVSLTRRRERCRDVQRLPLPPEAAEVERSLGASRLPPPAKSHPAAPPPSAPRRRLPEVSPVVPAVQPMPAEQAEAPLRLDESGVTGLSDPEPRAALGRPKPSKLAVGAAVLVAASLAVGGAVFAWVHLRPAPAAGSSGAAEAEAPSPTGTPVVPR